MNVTSSGHLTHHLEKLDGLVMTTPDGLYSLSDDGREALRVVGERGPSVDRNGAKANAGGRILVRRWLVVGAVASIIFLASMTGLVYSQLSSQIGAQQKEIDWLQELLGQYNVTTYADAADIGLGLRLSLSVNSSVISSNQTLAVGVSITNILGRTNNVSVASSWAYGFPPAFCGMTFGSLINYAPYNVAIFSGFYTLDDVSQGTPLPLYLEEITGTHNCPEIPVEISSFMFLPSSGAATVVRADNENTQVDSVGASLTIGAGTGANSWSPPISFTPGVYTVLAGDEWGQLVVLHFLVQ